MTVTLARYFKTVRLLRAKSRARAAATPRRAVTPAERILARYRETFEILARK